MAAGYHRTCTGDCDRSSPAGYCSWGINRRLWCDAIVQVGFTKFTSPNLHKCRPKNLNMSGNCISQLLAGLEGTKSGTRNEGNRGPHLHGKCAGGNATSSQMRLQVAMRRRARSCACASWWLARSSTTHSPGRASPLCSGGWHLLAIATSPPTTHTTLNHQDN
jgi:hypothetical protein